MTLQAIEKLYSEHRRDLLTFLVRRTGDTHAALDIWAETFAIVCTSRERFRGSTDDQAVAWLYGIARNQLALYHRRGEAQQRALRRLGLERPPTQPDLIEQIERDADLEELRYRTGAALESLSAPNRRAVELRVMHQLPYPEVARRLGITEATARARVSRSLSALANAMEPGPSEVAAT